MGWSLCFSVFTTAKVFWEAHYVDIIYCSFCLFSMLEVKDNTFFRFYFCRQDCYVSGRRQLLCYKEFRDSYKYCWDSFIDEILDGIRVARKWCKARKQIQ